MGPKGTLRAIQAAERREQREAQRRQRELERLVKEQAKLSAIEQARLEVETHENQIALLLSVHKERGRIWDWATLTGLLPPPEPRRGSYHEVRAKQRALILPAAQREGAGSLITEARLQDESAFQEAQQKLAKERTDWERVKGLAPRILAGEHKAYIEALVEFSPLAELSDLGSSMHFTVHSARLLECVLKVNGKQAIPAEVKSLTASEKLSVKQMPKGRFHEIYQDYLCGCVFRVAREVFALLPVEVLLITASADVLDPRTGRGTEQPVLSAVMPRMIVEGLEFDGLDPSDALENFQHRGNFKLSRKSEAFESIVPLVPGDIAHATTEGAGLDGWLSRVRTVRGQVQSKIAGLKPQRAALSPEPDPTL
jgi:hypothetical protein